MTKIERLRTRLELVQQIEDNSPAGVLADALLEVLDIVDNKNRIGFTNEETQE